MEIDNLLDWIEFYESITGEEPCNRGKEVLDFKIVPCAVDAVYLNVKKLERLVYRDKESFPDVVEYFSNSFKKIEDAYIGCDMLAFKDGVLSLLKDIENK